MPRSTESRLTRLVRAVTIGLLLTATAATAAPLPNAGRKVSIIARERPIAVFLQELLAQVDIPVV